MVPDVTNMTKMTGREKRALVDKGIKEALSKKTFKLV